MIFRMDTDSVRALAASFRRTASTMETSLESIRQSVRSAPWQSLAREEFIQQLEMLHNSTLRSAEVLHMMALAAEQKADQWEAIGEKFNGPFQQMGNIWNQIKDNMGWLWPRIRNALKGISWPSVPKIIGGVAVGTGVVIFSPVLVVGGFYIIKPDWFQKKPNWWPFTKSNFPSESSKVTQTMDGVKKELETELPAKTSNREEMASKSNTESYKNQYDGSTAAKGTIGRPWADINPPLTNSSNNRDPLIYDDVLNQFAVEKNSRYTKNQQGKNETYCNIYVWDVTKAMGAEIPHWVDGKGNSVPQGTGSELSANGTIGWLAKYGVERGWNTVDAEQAQALANLGKPVVASWKNPTGIGHVAMVRPGEYTSGSGPHLAQAGFNNSNHTTANEIFGSREVVYYYHE